MQRVSAFLPSWDRRSSSSGAKVSTPGFFSWGNKPNVTAPPEPTNSNSNAKPLANIDIEAANSRKIQREAFWPATLDSECDKAARILKSFCVDGYLAPSDRELHDIDSEPTGAEPPDRTLSQKIPKQIIQNAAGIAVFTCMRNGLWMTGSGGSGILIARKSDGTWSPPSGIMLHTPTLSFIIGVDIYDCVLVVNNLAALESMTRPRVTLGEDVALTNGPIVPTQSDELRLSWRDLGNTVLAYMKARGQHQEVNLSGCILTERANENERFYEGNITQMDVLAGNVNRHVEETKALFEVIKMAEGRTDFDGVVIDRTAALPAPGDAIIETPRATPMSSKPAFGIPKADDPDPFGVLALEMAGLEIREAGSRLRPASSQLEYNPSPLSPALSKFSRQSMETFNSRSNRGSYMSTRTVKSQVTDVATQTDTRGTSPSARDSEDEAANRPSNKAASDANTEVDYTTVDMSSLRHISQEYGLGTVAIVEETEPLELLAKEHTPEPTRGDTSSPSLGESLAKQEIQDCHENANTDGRKDEFLNDQDADAQEQEEEEEEDDDEEEEEEPVVFEVAEVQPARTQAVASRMIQARGNVVNIPKRSPPPLPKRSPARQSRLMKTDAGADFKSPLRQAFSEADLIPDDDKTAQSSQSDDAGSTGDLSDSNSLRSPPLDHAIAEVQDVDELDNALANVSKARVVSQQSQGSDATDEDSIPLDETERSEDHLAAQEEAGHVCEDKAVDADKEKGVGALDEMETQLETPSAEGDVAGPPQDPDQQGQNAHQPGTETSLATDDEPEVFDVSTPVSTDGPQGGRTPNEDEEVELFEQPDELAAMRESTAADSISETEVTIQDNGAEALSQTRDEEAHIADEEVRTSESESINNEVQGGDTADEVREEAVDLHDAESQPNIQATHHHLESDESQQSDDDEDPFELERTMPFAKSLQQSDEEEYEKHNLSYTGTDDTPDDDELPATPHNEQADTSDFASPNKHSSSIYTGVTEDRWSDDGSSLTTPTSDRAGSPAGSFIEGTPKKSLDRHSKSNQRLHTVNGDEEPLVTESGDTTPTTVEVQ